MTQDSAAFIETADLVQLVRTEGVAESAPINLDRLRAAVVSGNTPIDFANAGKAEFESASTSMTIDNGQLAFIEARLRVRLQADAGDFIDTGVV